MIDPIDAYHEDKGDPPDIDWTGMELRTLSEAVEIAQTKIATLEERILQLEAARWVETEQAALARRVKPTPTERVHSARRRLLDACSNDLDKAARIWRDHRGELNRLDAMLCEARES